MRERQARQVRKEEIRDKEQMMVQGKRHKRKKKPKQKNRQYKQTEGCERAGITSIAKK